MPTHCKVILEKITVRWRVRCALRLISLVVVSLISTWRLGARKEAATKIELSGGEERDWFWPVLAFWFLAHTLNIHFPDAISKCTFLCGGKMLRDCLKVLFLD